MSGLKKEMIGLRGAANGQGYLAITADEIDRYEVARFDMPGTSAVWWASAGTAGTSSAVALAIINRIPDYPRNINFALAGTGAGMAGTLVANGFDQFGSQITESLSFGTAANGGTVVGSLVFGQLIGGTLSYGTAVGNGTPAIGFVPGTGCLLGLPVKIRLTTDVVSLSMNAGTGPVTYNGGTIAGFVNTAVSAIRPVAALTGTQTIGAWVKSTYNAEQLGVVSNLQQPV